MSSGVEKTSHMNTLDKIRVTRLTASGIPAMIPAMGRRDYIKVFNTGGAIVEIGDSTLTVSGGNGLPIAATTGTWEDNTDALIYVVSTGANSTVIIYERASR